MLSVRMLTLSSCSVFLLSMQGCGVSHGLIDLGHGICLNTGTGIMWQADRGDHVDRWESAKVYADNLEPGGHADWRLPTKCELFILHNLFDLRKLGDCPLNPKGSYWLGNTWQEGKAGYWESYPLCGGTETNIGRMLVAMSGPCGLDGC